MSLTLMVLFVLLSCSSKDSVRKRNHEAIVLHNSMIKKANEIEHRLNEIRSDSTISKDSILTLSETLEQWKLDLVEVPGNEEHDLHTHNHSHSHTEMPELTEAQMLAIQKELDKRLSAIGTRIKNLKPELNHSEDGH
jgi:hypothetical protein